MPAILNAGCYGGDQAIAAPRGEGKTSIVQCVTIYCVMHGILSFPLIAAATGPNAEQILANIKYQLERNQALADDYPEICDPILALDGTAQRGATQTANGKRTFLKWAQDYIVLPTVRVPDHWDQRLRPGQLSLGSGAVITTRGLDSAIRGVLVGTKRPDLVIIDDPESARLGPQRRPDGPPRSARSRRTWPNILNRRQQRERRRRAGDGSACSPASFEISSGKNQPGYSVGQPENVEVDDQPERYVEQLHIAQQLRFVNRMNGLDCLDFDEQAPVD